MDLFENLSDNQIEAVKTIDEDLEIIACAGAGKIGVVTRRIINILKSNPDILPENIVAFTFMEKAAEELKSRVYKYGEAVLGNTKGFVKTDRRKCERKKASSLSRESVERIT